jgi:DNA-binding Lrp family transcriptional regulator
MSENTYILPKKPKIKEKTPAPDQRKFAVIPLHILSKAVTLESLRVLIVLSSYCNKAGFSHVSLNRIANDLGTTAQTVSYHMSRLQRLKIVKKISGHYTMIKGATRRIIYNDKISNEDASRIANAPIEPYNNSEITSMIKAKHINNNKDIEEVTKSHSSNESKLSYKEEVASLFESVSKESELLALEKLIESGEPPLLIKAHIDKGLSVLDYKS